MKHSFYSSGEYKKQQSKNTRLAWTKGLHKQQIGKTETRLCKRIGCSKSFQVKTYYVKEFCSQSCVTTFNNNRRGPLTETVKLRISTALTGKTYPLRKGKVLVPRLVKNCLRCRKIFKTERWQNHKYCSANCAIKDVGSKRTSPKAAKGKNGVRPDVHPEYNFYSRWEANYARILNFQKVKWGFQSKTFQLKTQKYTPDFYLPDLDEYIEIKNFMSDYSKQRDAEFRQLYPDIKLTVILKTDYLKLQERFSPLIKEWEFS